MNTLRNIVRIAAALIASVTAAVAAQVSDYDLPGVGGYDLVSYQQESGPVRGSGFHVSVHEGIPYLFASEENKAAFDANPENYLPAYNGYCAMGVALGQKFHTDPTVYAFVDGTLYLNLDGDIQAKWEQDLKGHIETANQNWKSLN